MDRSAKQHYILRLINRLVLANFITHRKLKPHSNELKMNDMNPKKFIYVY